MKGVRVFVNVGEVYETKRWGKVTVLSVKDSTHITVQFSDSNIKMTTAKELRTGSIKNNYQPEVCGVGYLGDGGFYCKTFGVKGNSPEYEVWRGMIRRCYDELSFVKHPTYKGCTVCPEWHNFQVFALWYVSQQGYSERFHLDKDLTYEGNKVYSPNTCSLIPAEVNSLFTGGGLSKRGKFPIGVHWCNTKKVFVAQIHRGKGGKQDFLGYHQTAEAAFIPYKLAKEAYVKEVANRNKAVLSEVIYNNLMNYTVSIID